MAFVPMTPAVPGTKAESAEYNKVVSNIEDLQDRMQSFGVFTNTLPDNVAIAAAEVFQTWGSDIVIPNPGIPVIVVALGCGYVLNDNNTGVHGRMRVGVSFNNGSSFNYGREIGDQAGNTGGNGSSTRRGGFTPHHGVSGTPSGDIRVRAQIIATSATIATFWGGAMTVLALPFTA